MSASRMAQSTMELRDGDDELFAEVLALLTEADADAVPAPTVKTLPLLKPSSATGSVARRKRAIDSLKSEEDELTEQLTQLQQAVFPVTQSHNEVKQRVLTERHKRRRAESECENLRDAVYEQMRFLRGLQGMMISDFEGVSTMLCRRLHDQMIIPSIKCESQETEMDAKDGDDAFLTELLALLTDADADATPTVEMQTPRKSSSATGSVARRKRAIDCLKAEESELSEQLANLQNVVFPASQANNEAKQRVLVERHKRRRAEDEYTQLRDAVFQQMYFLRGLHGILACNPDGVGSMRLNLCRHLHNYTRLPMDQSMRWCEYVALSRDERLTAATQLLHQEIARVSVSDSFVETEYFQESQAACAVTTKSVFAMEDCSVAELMQAVFVAVREIVIQCRKFRCIRASGEIVDAPTLSQSNLQYRIASVRRQAANDSADFVVESRQLTLYKLTHDSAVVLWDYVDVDELHPLVETPDIARQCIGACLIRREQCPDGVERTVYRELSTRRYEYRGCEPGSPPPSVQRYLSTMRVSMRSNELLFRDIIAKQVADGRKTARVEDNCNQFIN